MISGPIRGHSQRAVILGKLISPHPGLLLAILSWGPRATSSQREPRLLTGGSYV